MEINNANLVEAFRLSGLTQGKFCKENGIALERLRYYLYKKGRSKAGVKKSTQDRKHRTLSVLLS
jgi:hypothetical protein